MYFRLTNTDVDGEERTHVYFLWNFLMQTAWSCINEGYILNQCMLNVLGKFFYVKTKRV
jgi:hypothetical protein